MKVRIEVRDRRIRSKIHIARILERIAMVDRIIMIMAIGELLLEDPPPRAVVMDEAVELAKVFSTDGSASFVNGVLSACVEHLT